MKPNPITLAVTASTLSTALGAGLAANLAALQNQQGGLQVNDLTGIDLDTWIGRVDGLEQQALAEGLQAWQSRNNQLLEFGLQQDGFLPACLDLIGRYGSHRVGLFVGTTTSGIQAAEAAYQISAGQLQPGIDFDYQHSQNLYSPVSYLRQRLGVSGPGFTISTACSSSAKIFASARRHIQSGLCDAAIVVGLDSLCQMTLYGFNSLQLVATEVCRPADIERGGISIGEAMAAVILEPQTEPVGLCLLGYGESSDAWHMSTPHPEGAGALRAMQAALEMAEISATEVDYVNLHGTGTPANDLAEDRAMQQLFPDGVAASSTKGFCGHTLGAAGIVESLICGLALEHQFYPVSLNTRVLDPEIKSNIILPGQRQKLAPPSIAMSNSFGFGGSNAALLWQYFPPVASGYRFAEASASAAVTKLRIRVASVGLMGPGLHGWQNSRKFFQRRESPESRDMPALVPDGISPRERRRLTETIKLALCAGQDALLNLTTPLAIEQLSTIFASADGDLFVADKILTALTRPGKPVSPTHFHNSVHNAPAGYWHLASHSMHASTSIAAAGSSFASGLLEAVSQLQASAEACLLIMCDSRAPENYAAQIDSHDSLAVALVLTAEATDGHSEDSVLLELALGGEGTLSQMQDASLEVLRASNPAARALPLLELLSNPASESVVISANGSGLLKITRVQSE